MAESKERKSLLRRVKEESEKTGLKPNIQKTNIIASSPITSRQIEREKVGVTNFIFLGLKSLRMVTAAMKLKNTCSMERKLGQPPQHIKKQRHRLADKSPYSQSYAFSSSLVWM